VTRQFAALERPKQSIGMHTAQEREREHVNTDERRTGVWLEFGDPGSDSLTSYDALRRTQKHDLPRRGQGVAT
jgi:hypothetical protein